MIVFDHSGRQIDSTGADRTIRRWDRFTGQELQQFRGHETRVVLLAISPDERTLVSGDDGGSVRLWDLRSGRELLELVRNGAPLNSLEFTPDSLELSGWDIDMVEHRWSGKHPRRQGRAP